MAADSDSSPSGANAREGRFERRYKRERRARKSAEQLLETKSLELYRANRDLSVSHDRLEATVAERTHELVEARDAAENASIAKSHFLANMSHELRTPMNGVLAVASLLRDSQLDENQIEFVDIIKNSGERLLELINDILDLSKIEALELHLAQEPFSLEGCIEGVCSLLSVQARSKGIELIAAIADDAKGTFIGDSLRLRQVLINLISNAVKFTSEGSVVLDVTVQPIGAETAGASDGGDAPWSKIRFAVTDTGPGIAEDRCEAVFEAFSQADATVTRKHGGTGLGLAISYRIVDMMGGRLSLESEVGVGSTFSFEVQLEHAPEVPANSRAERTEVRDLTGTHVLVAEDNPINQRVISLILKKLGCTHDLAEDGLEVLRFMRNNTYDVVLMDWQMPEMSGIEASARIREMTDKPYSTIPIIAVTANAMRGDREQCLAVGMNDFISKPIDRAELAEKLAIWTRPRAA